MSNTKLILVHGMGQHTGDSFKNEFNDACKKAFNLYPSLAGKSAEDYVDLVPIGYNDIFDDYRKKIADTSKPIVNRLKLIPNMTDDLIGKVTNEITKIDNNVNDDSFFKTHWLDVILYRFSILGEPVRIRVAEKIVKTMESVKNDFLHVHVLAHSLGTAVVHDSLAKLYTENYKIGKKKASVDAHKLGSLHMIANTSRILESFIEVNKSVVKPGTKGCVAYYNEYRHYLDPITWPKAFNPTDNGEWISHKSWSTFNRYQLHNITSVTNKHGNTHSLEHYIFDPKVHLTLFKKVFGITTLTNEQIQEGYKNFTNKTLTKIAHDLEERLNQLKMDDIESISGLIKSINTLKEFVEELGGNYDI